MSRSTHLISLCVLALLAQPTRVFAGGAEVATGGVRGVARGGANAVSPNDPMAMLYNPAALANFGTDQFLLNADMLFHSQCVDPYGYYGWGIYEGGRSEFSNTSPDRQDNAVNNDYLNQPLDPVCNSGPPGVIPQLVMSMKLTKELGIAFGFANAVAVGNSQWGGKDGTIQTDNGARPTPTRYQLVETTTIPTSAISVGAGYRALPWLSFGLTLQWLGAETHNAVVQAANAGTSPHSDMFVRIKARDYFVPTATLSVLAKPTPNIEVMAGFHWSDSFDGSGSATYTTNHYQYGSNDGPITFTNPAIAIDQIYNRLPWTLTLGGRYADVIAPPDTLVADTEHPADSLQNERWDVELNLVWNMLGRASASALGVSDTCFLDENGNRERVVDGAGQSLGYHEGCQTLQFRTSTDRMTNATTYDVPPLDGKRNFDLNRHWQDQVIVRVGGSYNPIPNRLGFNAGAFYETRGINASFATIDAMPFSRIGLALGATVRLGAWDLSLAYSHIFQETLIVAPPPHQNRQSGVAGDPTTGFDQRIGAECTADAPAEGCAPVADPSVAKNPDAIARLQQSSILEQEGQLNRVVNAGKYTASYNALSLGFNYRF